MPLFDRRFLRFISVGLATAAVDVGTVALLLRGGISYGLAVTGGFALGLVVNYLLHASYTFGVRPHAFAQALRFGAVVAFNYLLTLFIVWALHEGLGTPVLAAKIASLPCVAAAGFLLSKYWVFRAAAAAPPGG